MCSLRRRYSTQSTRVTYFFVNREMQLADSENTKYFCTPGRRTKACWISLLLLKRETIATRSSRKGPREPESRFGWENGGRRRFIHTSFRFRSLSTHESSTALNGVLSVLIASKAQASRIPLRLPSLYPKNRPLYISSITRHYRTGLLPLASFEIRVFSRLGPLRTPRRVMISVPCPGDT